MAWMTGAEALAVLAVQPHTLDANVSRGRIRAKPDPKDFLRSLYNSEDVQCASPSGAAGRRPAASVAAAAIDWGDPVLPSGVSTAAEGRGSLVSRSRRDRSLRERQSGGSRQPLMGDWGYSVRGARETRRSPPYTPPLRRWRRLSSSFLDAPAAASPSLGRSRAVLVAEAADLVDDLATAMLGSP